MGRLIPMTQFLWRGAPDGQRRAPAGPAAPRLGHGEAGPRVGRRVLEVDGHPAEGVDQAGEADEVDLHVAVDGDAEGVGDRVDQPGRPAA